MKPSIILFIGLFIFTFVSNATTKLLYEDILDVYGFVYSTEMKELVEDYMENDSEVKAVKEYVESHPESEQIISSLTNKPKMLALVTWLFLQLRENFVLIVPGFIQPIGEKHWTGQRTGGWKGFIEDQMKIATVNEFRNLISQKSAENHAFAELVEKVKALKYVYDDFINEPAVTEMISNLNNIGFDFEATDNCLKQYLEWN